MNDRYVVLDTETTGLDVSDNHRIIEIGCVEIINRSITKNTFHQYINPERLIDASATSVHGITNDKLMNQPVFADIKDNLISFINNGQVIAHNASFDIGFLEKEFNDCGIDIHKINLFSKIHDTLAMARELYPGKRNSLDALCSRLNVDNSSRELHGALLDAELLAQVYLRMTMGQSTLSNLFEDSASPKTTDNNSDEILNHRKKIIKAPEEKIILLQDYFSCYLLFF